MVSSVSPPPPINYSLTQTMQQYLNQRFNTFSKCLKMTLQGDCHSWSVQRWQTHIWRLAPLPSFINVNRMLDMMNYVSWQNEDIALICEHQDACLVTIGIERNNLWCFSDDAAFFFRPGNSYVKSRPPVCWIVDHLLWHDHMCHERHTDYLQ